jgi:ketosteroid isomerase-like protein
MDAVTTRGMGDDHPNALAYLRTAEAFRQGDFDTIAALIAEDVVWHVPGDHPLAGDWDGRDVVLQRLATLSSLGFTLREHDVFGDDDHVCALSYMGARRDGLEVETRVVSIFHFRDGRQTERWLYPDDAVAWNSIFGG